MQTHNVLKYPGSKWRIADKLVKLIPPHHSYLEPCFGSGAVFYSKPPSAIETINDLDGDVVNLYDCIRQDAERLARIIMTTPYARSVYDMQFIGLPPAADPFERAANFLVRAWQSHGFRTNGVKVGWKRDIQGRERMYALWDWYRLPTWVIEVAERLRQVQIECRPAIEVIQAYNHHNVFMYIDPPYLPDTRSSGKQYKHEMTVQGHEELLQTLLHVQAKVMLSGYSSRMYDDALQGWKRREFASHTQLGAHRQEVIWCNYEIGEG